MAPDAEDASVKVPTMMTTADMAMREDQATKKYQNVFMRTQTSLQMLQGLGSSYYTEIWDPKQDIWGQKFLKRN